LIIMCKSITYYITECRCTFSYNLLRCWLLRPCWYLYLFLKRRSFPWSVIDFPPSWLVHNGGRSMEEKRSNHNRKPCWAKSLKPYRISAWWVKQGNIEVLNWNILGYYSFNNNKKYNYKLHVLLYTLGVAVYSTPIA